MVDVSGLELGLAHAPARGLHTAFSPVPVWGLYPSEVCTQNLKSHFLPCSAKAPVGREEDGQRQGRAYAGGRPLQATAASAWSLPRTAHLVQGKDLGHLLAGGSFPNPLRPANILEEVSVCTPEPFSRGSNSSSLTHSLCDFGQVLNLSVPQFSHP